MTITVMMISILIDSFVIQAYNEIKLKKAQSLVSRQTIL